MLFLFSIDDQQTDNIPTKYINDSLIKNEDGMFIFSTLDVTSNDAEFINGYCEFVHQYTLKLYSRKEVSAFISNSERNLSIFKLIIPSDEAYALFVFINGYSYWKDMTSQTREQQTKNRREKTFKYPNKKWTTKAKHGFTKCSVTEVCMMVYRRLLKKMLGRRQNTDHWYRFLSLWNNYCEKHKFVLGHEIKRKRKESGEVPDHKEACSIIILKIRE